MTPQGFYSKCEVNYEQIAYIGRTLYRIECFPLIFHSDFSKAKSKVNYCVSK
jgi:hypothetical protein